MTVLKNAIEAALTDASRDEEQLREKLNILSGRYMDAVNVGKSTDDPAMVRKFIAILKAQSSHREACKLVDELKLQLRTIDMYRYDSAAVARSMYGTVREIKDYSC